MFKCVFTSFVLAFVSGFGLLSCASDKSSAPAPLRDSFRLSPPVILTDRGPLSILGETTLSTVFSTEHMLSFPSLAGLDFNSEPVKFVARTECKGRTLAKADDLRFENIAEIALRDLLPPDALLQPKGSDETTTCQIHFMVHNRHGSAHEFTLPNLTIHAPPSALGLDLHSTDHAVSAAIAQPTVQLDETAIALLRLEGQPRADAIGSTHLLCEGFKTTLANREIELNGVRPLAHRLPNAYTGRPIQDQVTDPRQICRIVSEATVDKQRVLRASPQFVLQFAPPKLTVHARIEFDNFPGGRLHRIPVFTATIHNPHPLPIPAAISKGRPNSLALNGIFMDTRGLFFTGQTMETPVSLELEGATALPDEALLKFIVPPNATVVVRAHTQIPFICTWRGGRVVEFSEGFWGFYYELDPAEFALLQTPDNALEANNTFTTGTKVTFLALPGSKYRDRPRPNWAPWTTTFQSGAQRNKAAPEPATLQPNNDLVQCGRWR